MLSSTTERRIVGVRVGLPLGRFDGFGVANPFATLATG
jgi:hypothetical protein